MEDGKSDAVEEGKCEPTELKMSPSIEEIDSFDNVMSEFSSDWPADWDQRKGVISMMLARTFTTRISSIRLLQNERDCLIGPNSKLKNKPLPRAAQVLVWRRTLLRTGAFFYLFVTCLDISMLLTNLFEGYGSIFSGRLPERYQDCFVGTLILQYMFQAGVLCGNACSVWYAAKAAVGWWSYKHSSRKVGFSFLFSYLPNFILLLCLPFNSGVDFVGVQRQLCQDITSPNKGEGIPMMPARFKEAPLAQQLKESYDMELPDDFCEGDPAGYGDKIRQLLEEEGRIEVNGTCAAAGRFQERMGGLVGPIEDCSEKCQACVRDPCQAQLVALATLAGIYGPEALSRPSLPEVKRRCAYCVQSGPQGCQTSCPAVMNAVLAKSPAGSDMGGLGEEVGLEVPIPSAEEGGERRLDGGRRAMANGGAIALTRLLPQCMDPDDIKSLADLSRLLLMVTQWKILLGVKYAGDAILKLLPLSFSIMMATWKAAGISKSIVPYSRMPGFAAGASVLFTFPFVFQILVVIQTVMGSILSLFAFLLLMCAVLVNFPMRIDKLNLIGIAEPMSHAKAWEQVKRIKSIQLLTAGVGIILLLSYLTTNEIFRAGADFAGYEVSDDHKEAMKSMLIQSSTSIIVSMLGKALISTVFFVDACLKLMHKFLEKDTVHVETSRAKLMEHIHGLWGKKKGPVDYESQVSPMDDDEEEEDPTEQLTLKTLKDQAKDLKDKAKEKLGTSPQNPKSAENGSNNEDSKRAA